MLIHGHERQPAAQREVDVAVRADDRFGFAEPAGATAIRAVDNDELTAHATGPTVEDVAIHGRRTAHGGMILGRDAPSRWRVSMDQVSAIHAQ